MSISIIDTYAKIGITSPKISVEVHISNGLPRFTMVGLPQTVVQESRDRVRSAIINSQFEFPNRRITVNLAPADIPKEGGRYDLPIALGVLVATSQIDKSLIQDKIFLGELSLDGRTRPVDGIIPAMLEARKNNLIAVIPSENEADIQIISNLRYISCSSLRELETILKAGTINTTTPPLKIAHSYGMDFSDIKGQHQAKRAMLISAAGRHNILMIGPPGTGKTMLAERLKTILPDLDEEESIETASIYSISNMRIDFSSLAKPPFRSPHHSSSVAALIGGGGKPMPGETSLAHNGVLFLDELGEFHKKVLDNLRQSLESKISHIARAREKVSYPANFQLVCAMNPLEKDFKADVFDDDYMRRLSHRLSAPFLDRIDIQIEVPRVKNYELKDDITSSNLLEMVAKARDIQKKRGFLNCEIPTHLLDEVCALAGETNDMMMKVVDKFGISSRGHSKILKVARTIADLIGSPSIAKEHISEAIGYRIFDRYKS